MNAPTPVDLGYADRALPPDFLQRTRQQGRAIKRRRRAGVATAGVATAALIGVLTVQFLGSAPRGLGVVADPAASATTSASVTATPSATPTPSAAVTPATKVDLSDLPYSTGTDPSARYTGSSDRAPVVWATDGTGKQSLTWIDAKGTLCIGERTSPAADLIELGCGQLSHAPAEGLWRNEIVARRGGVRLGLGSPEPVDASVYGLVRGPVDRLIVDLPLTGPVDAALKPAPDGLGTLYWLTTRDFTIDGKVVGAGTLEQNFPLKMTIYRGDTPVFHCEDQDCYPAI